MIYNQGLVHFDISSNNVILSQKDGKWEPYLIDFGSTQSISDLPLLQQQAVRNFVSKYSGPGVRNNKPKISDDFYSIGLLWKSIIDQWNLERIYLQSALTDLLLYGPDDLIGINEVSYFGMIKLALNSNLTIEEETQFWEFFKKESSRRSAFFKEQLLGWVPK